MLLAPDALLGERYLLQSRIAVGGMGEVWRAADTVLGREVAVKVLKGELTGAPGFLRRFRDEARHTAALAHPGIASIYDYGEASSPGAQSPDTAYLVMELVAGEPLSAVLDREGRLPADRALDMIAQAARALQAAHDAGVIHRDVKPANILVQPDGTVKITDFGIARVIGAAPVTATGVVMGTAYYVSPEQAAGDPVTPATDIYSLGVVGYEALAGRRPFPGDNPLSVALRHINEPPAPLEPDIAPGARAVVERAMAKRPADRFPTAQAMSAAADQAHMSAAADQARGAVAIPAPTQPLTQLLPQQSGSLPVAASRPGPAGRRPALHRWPRPAILLLGALLLAALITLATRALTGNQPATHSPAHTASPAASPPASPAASRPAATVLIDPGDYTGEPYAEVRAALIQRGLRVREAFTDKGGPAGTVTGVTPTGALPVGTMVTVTVVADASGKKKKKKEGD